MCRSCGNEFTDAAGPHYASAVPGLCVTCVAEFFEADHWVECWPAHEDSPYVTVMLTAGPAYEIQLEPNEWELLMEAPEVAGISPRVIG